MKLRGKGKRRACETSKRATERIGKTEDAHARKKYKEKFRMWEKGNLR